MAEHNREREAAMDFGRQLADPGFREVLAAYGYSGAPQDVVVALDDTSVGEVLDRVFTRCRPPALVAIRRPGSEHGFALLMVAPNTASGAAAGQARRGGNNRDRLSEDTSIGMLYDSMRQTDGMTFEMGRQRSYEIQRIADPAMAGA